MADEFELNVALEIEAGGISAFIQEVTAGLRTIEDEAEKASKSGASTRGLSKSFEKGRVQVQRTIANSGASDAEIARGHLEATQAFRDAARTITRSVPSFSARSVLPVDEAN